MKCPYCKEEIKQVDSIGTSTEELREMVCTTCQIRFDMLFLDGECVDIYARKIVIH